VKGKKSLKDSLDASIEGEILKDQNSYFCEPCDEKKPTMKRQSIKKLPNVLIFVLKRFEYDLNTMNKIKVNDYF
jgi:ubiquitin C-terminal hydrolase